jgi:hypothetical protein
MVVYEPWANGVATAHPAAASIGGVASFVALTSLAPGVSVDVAPRVGAEEFRRYLLLRGITQVYPQQEPDA